jgi:sRNA-binding carbon storage regulator CsrA
MDVLIQTDKQRMTDCPPIPTYPQDVIETPRFSEIYAEQLPKAEPLAQTRYSTTISKINHADVEEIYQTIKQEVKEELDVFNVEGKALDPIDYLSDIIDKIMSGPIEVKIERDEIYQAIIYNRLGISYLEVKKLEVKIELLSLVKDEVAKQKEKGIISADQAQLLYDKIEGNIAQLEEEKKKLLEGHNVNQEEELFFEQLTKQKNFNL